MFGKECLDCGAWHGQLGLEPNPALYVSHLVAIFRELRRVLRPDGVLALNMGDSYASEQTRFGPWGVKPKDLFGVPHRLAFALQADGWHLRLDCVWEKASPNPESAADRPNRAHEYVFLLTRSPEYYWDRVAIMQPATSLPGARPAVDGRLAGTTTPEWVLRGEGRNRRSVFRPSSQGFGSGHTAQFPKALVEPFVLAGSGNAGVCAACGAPHRRVIEPSAPGLRIGQRVRRVQGDDPQQAIPHDGYAEALAWKREHPDRDRGFQASCGCGAGVVPAVAIDPFCGTGTSGIVAVRHGRRFIGIELSPASAADARQRLTNDAATAAGRRADALR